MRLQMRGAKMSLELSLRDKVQSSGIWRDLRVESLLLCVKRSLLRKLGHLITMPHGRLPLDVLQARPSSTRPQGTPRTHWSDYISHVSWEHLRIPLEQLENIAVKRDGRTTLLYLLLPPRPYLWIRR